MKALVVMLSIALYLVVGIAFIQTGIAEITPRILEALQ